MHADVLQTLPERKLELLKIFLLLLHLSYLIKVLETPTLTPLIAVAVCLPFGYDGYDSTFF